MQERLERVELGRGRRELSDRGRRRSESRRRVCLSDSGSPFPRLTFGAVLTRLLTLSRGAFALGRGRVFSIGLRRDLTALASLGSFRGCSPRRLLCFGEFLGRLWLRCARRGGRRLRRRSCEFGRSALSEERRRSWRAHGDSCSYACRGLDLRIRIVGAERRESESRVELILISRVALAPESDRRQPHTKMEGAAPPTPMHHLAILLSRALNTLNPNDQLASTVYSLSKHHATVEAFHKAITSFGKFSLAQAHEVYDFCQTQDTLDKAFNNPNGITVTDHDVLAPDAPVRAGLTTATPSDKHVFKQPASRTSTLGLDRLAADKRREKEALERSEKVKRVKYDEDEDSTSSGFKSECNDVLVPSSSPLDFMFIALARSTQFLLTARHLQTFAIDLTQHPRTEPD